jgi:hypothetical protein
MLFGSCIVISPPAVTTESESHNQPLVNPQNNFIIGFARSLIRE